ncbi:MAG: ArsS family sensor histidine kinase [Sulfurimonas sp.]|nr:ArsS family sensor histidine kinase [Sulfurimonas sp.]
MKFNSIITNIKIGFSITVVLFIVVFIAFVKYSNHEDLKQVSHSYATIQTHLFTNRLESDEVIEYVQSLNFELVAEHPPILDKATNKIGGKGFESIESDGNYYLLIHAPHFRLMFKDLNVHEKNYYGYIFFGILFASFIFIYFWIIRALQPLKTLKNEIQRFANGDLDINCKSENKDEIAEIANEFEGAVKKIKLLLESRQLFLRTIMHELKTPIAKGRIVSELIDDEKQKKRIITIFEKLNYQIDDFAKIEQIVSNNYTPHIYPCKINKIIEKSCEMLMLDSKENILIQLNADRSINADIELIALAVKNLLDNGLKYSSDAKVRIIAQENSLDIISHGAPLQKPLEEYYKPFHNESQGKNHGMGLGLYIVHAILKMHKMELEYKHQDDQNIFSLIYFH